MHPRFLTLPAVALLALSGCSALPELKSKEDLPNQQSETEFPLADGDVERLFVDGRLADCELPMPFLVQAGFDESAGLDVGADSTASDVLLDGKSCAGMTAVDSEDKPGLFISMINFVEATEFREGMETEEVAEPTSFKDPALADWTVYRLEDTEMQSTPLFSVFGPKGTPLEQFQMTASDNVERVAPLANDLMALTNRAVELGVLTNFDGFDNVQAPGEGFKDARTGAIPLDQERFARTTEGLDTVESPDTAIEFAGESTNIRTWLSDVNQLTMDDVVGSSWGRLCFNLNLEFDGGIKALPTLVDVASSADERVGLRFGNGGYSTAVTVQEPTLNPEHTAVPMCSQTTSIARGDIVVTMNDDFSTIAPADLPDALPAWTFSVDMRDGDFIIDADGAEDPDFVATKTDGD